MPRHLLAGTAVGKIVAGRAAEERSTVWARSQTPLNLSGKHRSGRSVSGELAVIRRLPGHAYASTISGMPAARVAVPAAVAAILLVAVAFGTNREIARVVNDQIAEDEGAFCMKLGQLPGAQYDACMRDVATLIRHEQELTSVEF